MTGCGAREQGPDGRASSSHARRLGADGAEDELVTAKEQAELASSALGGKGDNDGCGLALHVARGAIYCVFGPVLHPSSVVSAMSIDRAPCLFQAGFT
ncbi:unnamed protein product [Lampetra fluviatilis]